MNAVCKPGGKGTRPKRGKYRNYDRDSLVEAVRAVQRGEMSVHRAGSYYGVPHSTLEYKVKERHLMRPRKRDPKPNPVDEKIASLKQASAPRHANHRILSLQLLNRVTFYNWFSRMTSGTRRRLRRRLLRRRTRWSRWWRDRRASSLRRRRTACLCLCSTRRWRRSATIRHHSPSGRIQVFITFP